MKYDEIDKKILETVEELSGSQVTAIVNRLGALRADQTIRTRMNALDIQGAILLDRQKERGKVFAIITPYGRELLAEGRDRRPAGAEQQ